MTKGSTNLTRIVVAEFITDIKGAAARLAANERHLALSVPPVTTELEILADVQILSAVVGNVLQNAFNFTRPRTTVALRVAASADRILIEVEDECGGLPGWRDAKELPPSFEQRAADRSGLGIGLAFSRWGAEANNGRLYGRSLPGKGCVLTVDLPRAPVPAVETT
jgi:signal transduction histidine kinase